MIILIIILAYIASVFLCRWIEIEYAWWKYNTSYKRHIYPFGWFLSVIYIVIIGIDYLMTIIDNKRKQTEANRFTKWFFVSHLSRIGKDKNIDNYYKELFNR
jgi:hypothetical protein